MTEERSRYNAGPERADSDTLDAVELTPAAVAAWLDLSRLIAKHGAALGLRPEDIPDEQAEPQADGSLVIRVDLTPTLGRVAMTVPPGAWRWRAGTRQ